MKCLADEHTDYALKEMHKGKFMYHLGGINFTKKSYMLDTTSQPSKKKPKPMSRNVTNVSALGTTI